MLSEKYNSYLHSIIRDSTAPFLYRSTIRSLLGMPDRYQSTLIFPSSVPPVQFQYMNYALTHEPYAALYETVEETIKPDKYDIPSATTSTQKITEPENEKKDRSMIAENTSHEQTNPVNKNDDKLIQKKVIDIPGVSKSRHSFPVKIVNKEEQNRDQVRSKRESQKISQDNSLPHQSGPVMSSRTHDKGEERLHMTGKTLESRKSSFPGHISEPLHKENHPLPELRFRSKKSEPVIKKSGHKSYRSTQEKIAQIRSLSQPRFSHVSVSKSPDRTETKETDRKENRKEQVQEIVVIKRVKQKHVPTSSPAFWERNYLSHFYLNTMR